MRVSFGADVGRLSCFRSQNRTALVESEHCCKVSLRHACKGPRRAQLPTRDEVAASIGHRRPFIVDVRIIAR